MTRKDVLEYLSFQDFAPRTRQVHVQHLLSLIEHAQLAQVDPYSVPIILSYLSSLKPHAKKRAWSVFYKFFQWRQLEGLAVSSPMSRVPRPRASTRPNPGLSESDLVAILDQLERDLVDARGKLNQFASYRLRSIIHLCLSYGLSSSELLTLNRKDWNARERRLITRRGKNETVCSIDLDPVINDALVTYDISRSRLARGMAMPQPLFICQRGKRLTIWALRSQFGKLAARAGLELEKGGIHQLRHTMAGIMARRGDSVWEISQYLGHKSISATDHYIRNHFKSKSQSGVELVRRLMATAPEAPGGKVLTFPKSEGGEES